MNLYSVNLPNGPIHLSSVNEVNQKVSALLRPWLGKALVSGARISLPLPAVAHFSATAEEDRGGLLIKLWAPRGRYRPERPHAGPTEHLATIGVGRDKHGGQRLWSKLLRDAQVPWRELPGAPWCAVLPEPSILAKHPSASEWLGDLADGLARAWLARTSVPDDFQDLQWNPAASAPAMAGLSR
jgi:hypothetical protein